MPGKSSSTPSLPRPSLPARFAKRPRYVVTSRRTSPTCRSKTSKGARRPSWQASPWTISNLAPRAARARRCCEYTARRKKSMATSRLSLSSKWSTMTCRFSSTRLPRRSTDIISACTSRCTRLFRCAATGRANSWQSPIPTMTTRTRNLSFVLPLRASPIRRCSRACGKRSPRSCRTCAWRCATGAKCAIACARRGTCWTSGPRVRIRWCAAKARRCSTGWPTNTLRSSATANTRSSGAASACS